MTTKYNPVIIFGSERSVGNRIRALCSAICHSRWSWLLWNPVWKVHSRLWGPKAPNGGCEPHINGKPSEHSVQLIRSILGWGCLVGWEIRHGKRQAVMARRWWGRVELRPKMVVVDDVTVCRGGRWPMND